MCTTLPFHSGRADSSCEASKSVRTTDKGRSEGEFLDVYGVVTGPQHAHIVRSTSASVNVDLVTAAHADETPQNIFVVDDIS